MKTTMNRRRERKTIFVHSILVAALCSPSLQSAVSRAALGPETFDERRVTSSRVDGLLGNWPGWRGNNGSGVSDEKNLPTEWSDSVNVIWKTPLAGSGNSSPVVWGDRVFLTTAENGGKRRSVLCFDRANGKQLWMANCPSDATEVTDDKGRNGYASSTPATDGERVYAFFGSAGVMAVDFDGKLAWHRDLGPFTSQYGIASSPTLFENLLFLNCDQGTDDGPAGSFLVALDRNTGEKVWRTERAGHSHSWSTPVLVPADGSDRLELVLNGENQIRSYDPRTGEPLWSCDVNDKSDKWVTPTVVSGGGLVFAASAPLTSGPLLAIRSGGRGDVTNSHVVWQSKRGGSCVPSPILYKGRLYVVNDGGIMSCFDAMTGKTAFQGRLQGSEFDSSLVAADDKLYITSREGQTFVLAADAKLRILSTNPLGEPCHASPALSRGQIFIRTERHLWCIGKP